MASLRTLDSSVYPLAQAFVRLIESPVFAHALGLRRPVRVTVTSARRDLATQQRLYDAFLAGRSKFPAAPPGASPHALGIAFDVHLEPNTPRTYELAGLLWEHLGFRWGGRFSDPIHFDVHPVGWVPPPRVQSAAEKRAKARLARR